MKITGINLVIVHAGLRELVASTKNHIATCPDPKFYAKDLKDAEAALLNQESLLKRVEAALKKEGHLLS